MWVNSADMVSAGRIEPDGKTEYVVVWADEHKSLKPDDVVVMSETPSFENVFIRTEDMTIHSLSGEGSYVLVVPRWPNRKRVDDAAKPSIG
ncbi:hypothetical protein [Frigoriglobus tundricola]|uniref:Uncharacterized protein n=1 Tax=Frigoriglobus tundricola TaxID=2774151 RepID=A0A6M5YNB2_9BACT|nr:hypothetical protein [Frigoriglobus tundricola]QJW94731.1 hypothetical protein FTUN_2253 [Frigoriglobus tundricola]